MPQPAPTDASPPEWSRIPCAVPCARCGADLRGLAAPQCAACGLEFTWAEAVPREALRCPDCGYDLYGLPSARCAECGRSFAWGDLHRPRSALVRRLFEYRSRAEPVRSFLYTLLATQRSRWFWRSISIQDPVRPGSLGILLVLLLLAGGGGAIALHALADYGLWRDVQRWIPNSRRTFAWRSLTSSEFWTGLLLFASWVACSLGALLLFPQSMRRARVRRDQLWRVGVYAAVAPGAGAVVLVAVLLAASFSSNALLLPAAYPAWFGIVALAAAAGAGGALRNALRDYLKVPHALSMAIAVQAIAVLATWTIMRALPPRPIALQARRALNYVTHLVLTSF